MDKKWLEYQIIKMAEKYPDRVGPRRYGTTPNTHCIVAQAIHDATGGGCCAYKYSKERATTARVITSILAEDSATLKFAIEIARLNDAGHTWGEIPKLAGIVPGEMEIENGCHAPMVVPQPVKL